MPPEPPNIALLGRLTSKNEDKIWIRFLADFLSGRLDKSYLNRLSVRSLYIFRSKFVCKTYLVL